MNSMMQGLFFSSPISFIVSLSTRSLVERIDRPKGKGEGFGMKLFKIMVFLVALLSFGCSEPNPLKWRPMDLAPAATLEKRNNGSLGSLGHFQGTVDNGVTGQVHGLAPES